MSPIKKIKTLFSYNVADILIPYFSLLLLYFFYQVIAASDYSILTKWKGIFFLVSAAGLNILLLLKTNISYFTFSLKVGIIGLIGTLIIFCGLWEKYFFKTDCPIIRQFSISCFMGLILIGTALILSLLNKRKTSRTESISLSKRISIGAIVSMVPGLFFASKNPDYLHGRYYVYYILVIVLFSMTNYFWLTLISGGLVNKSRLAFHAALFSFLFILLPFINSYFVLNHADDLVLIVLFLVVSVLFHCFEKQVTFNRLAFFAIAFSLASFVSIINNVINFNIYNNRKTISLPKQLESIDFKTTPNIYLFVYDGMPNCHIFDYLSLPKNRLIEILNSYGFKIYNNTYSLGASSIFSMAAMLNCSVNNYNSEKARDAYSGNSLANLTFGSKGYKTYNLLEDYFTGIYAILNRKLVHETYPAVKIGMINLNFFMIFINGIFQGRFKCNTKGLKMRDCYTSEGIQKRKHEIIMNGERKKLVVNHFNYPGHTQNSGKCLPDEKDLWIRKLNIALDQMEKDFTAIQKYDSSAITIALSDHGPFLTGDCYNLFNWKENITADMIWDRVGTMIAIKWPDKDKATLYDRDLILNQDIFPVVFSYLSENDKYLKIKPDRTFHGFNISFKEGVIIK
jgi:hypothetical protein